MSHKYEEKAGTGRRTARQANTRGEKGTDETSVDKAQRNRRQARTNGTDRQYEGTKEQTRKHGWGRGRGKKKEQGMTQRTRIKRTTT